LVRRLSQQGDGAIPQSVKIPERPNSRVVKPLAYIRPNDRYPHLGHGPFGQIATCAG
jgi:hypothetical protein